MNISGIPQLHAGFSLGGSGRSGSEPPGQDPAGSPVFSFLDTAETGPVPTARGRTH